MIGCLGIKPTQDYNGNRKWFRINEQPFRHSICEYFFTYLLTLEVSGNSQASSSGENVNNNNPLDDAQETPKNIDVVNVKICQKGLGLGFVDGMETAVRREGIYIRFLLPENTPYKVSDISVFLILICLVSLKYRRCCFLTRLICSRC